ncbi:hypothetical protein [Paenibacillus guangzhouensis]|uniref:hypothetical protein n=1 Tax=Paenibacillus guangzhouensis TaxID=1473112 RepID=UPI0012677A0E|nr:hypothetical protein [Paenibacillus guangzhouensis]
MIDWIKEWVEANSLLCISIVLFILGLIFLISSIVEYRLSRREEISVDDMNDTMDDIARETRDWGMGIEVRLNRTYNTVDKVYSFNELIRGIGYTLLIFAFSAVCYIAYLW